jgi:hypothetical protein
MDNLNRKLSDASSVFVVRETTWSSFAATLPF